MIMRRDAIDFHRLPVGQEQLHARLENWAAWAVNKAHAKTSPMFRLYRNEGGSDTVSREIDTLDAYKMEQAVAALPPKHAFALRWCYVFKYSPIKACRLNGCTLVELAGYVDDGRAMLINRAIRGA